MSSGGGRGGGGRGALGGVTSQLEDMPAPPISRLTSLRLSLASNPLLDEKKIPALVGIFSQSKGSGGFLERNSG